MDDVSSFGTLMRLPEPLESPAMYAGYIRDDWVLSINLSHPSTKQLDFDIASSI